VGNTHTITEQIKNTNWLVTEYVIDFCTRDSSFLGKNFATGA
jgi:hypothetical protein